MTPEQALHTAMGYSWGREDATGTRTVSPGDRAGSIVFAEAYAAGWENYAAGRRMDMIPVADAYANWQASGGRSVFRRGNLTLTAAQTALLHRAWHENDADPYKHRYYELRTHLQATAWAALAPA